MLQFTHNVATKASPEAAVPLNNRDPSIAILIPVYNEEPVMQCTIKSLLDADIAKHDIYIVDDKSTDATYAIAKALGVNVFSVPENGGKANAQRQALEHFQLCEKYDWVIFLDGDTKVHPYFYNAMFAAAKKDPSVALYVGEVTSAKNDHIYSAMRAFDYTFGHDIAKRAQSNWNVVYVSPGCASMYRSDVLSKLDIATDTLAEDMDLTIQVHKAGLRVEFLPEAIVITQDPSTFADYKKQITRWSCGFWQIVRKYNVGSIFNLHKHKAVDWYMLLLMVDGLIFNKVLWSAIVFIMMSPAALGWIFLADVSFTTVIAIWCAYRTKRLDVLTKLPIYYWLSLVQLYVWTKAFVEIIVLRKEILTWNKVKRYDFSSN